MLEDAAETFIRDSDTVASELIYLCQWLSVTDSSVEIQYQISLEKFLIQD